MKRMVKLMLLLCLILATCGNQAKESANTNQTETKETVSAPELIKSVQPTLFLHGYQGTENSLKNMMTDFEKQGIAQRSRVIRVSASGEVREEETGALKDNPMIQVLFEDNQNNEWNQAEWIANVLRYLKEHGGVSQVKLVGHSMGGVSSLRYLTAYGQDLDLPQVTKVVTLGAPFNEFIELAEGETVDSVVNEGPVTFSERFAEYQQNIANVPQTTQFLLIAGDLDDGTSSDGMVPTESAVAVAQLLRGNGNSVARNVYHGAKAQHSQLHENQEVDKEVADFLWK